MIYQSNLSREPDPPTLEALRLHRRVYLSTLKSSGEIRLSSLQETHNDLKPTLHSLGGQPQVDLSAFIYTTLRLPEEIYRVKTVILGQSFEVFNNGGYPKVETWQMIFAPGRRRRVYYDRHDNLACFITSVSDIDDLVNLLIAFQEEWNKLHEQLQLYTIDQITADLDQEAWRNLQVVWGSNLNRQLNLIKEKRIDIRVKLLAGCWLDYTKVVQKWWKNISASLKPDLRLSHQSIYFVSSNLHSLSNLTSAYALKIENRIATFLKKASPDLYLAYKNIKLGQSSFPLPDFLYYASKKLYQSDPQEIQLKKEYDHKLGLRFIPALHFLDVNAQVIPLNLLSKKKIDPRLIVTRPDRLAKSRSYIVNIDYPLGFAAYHVLSEVMENMAEIRGIYIMGKAASLNGNIGDILIPNIVHDEHSGNTYLLKNCFNRTITRKMTEGSILDNQKGVSVLGTFLQNEALINQYSRNNLTIIEMENGPYLNAVCEAIYPDRYPNQTVVDLTDTPFDLGLINYVSDTPYSKAKNLGVRNLSLDGVEPTYFAAQAILQRIIHLEEKTSG